MIFDPHCHIQEGPIDHAKMIQRFEEAGVDAACLFSLDPAPAQGCPVRTPEYRLDNLFEWCSAGDHLYPVYWIKPEEDSAPEQVAMAVERGVVGFKVICSRVPPGDRRAMRTYREIARSGRPVLFHSGILWDGWPSGMFNRPVEFEPLLEVAGLRFALAHIGWPWVDELLAVYGKFLNAAGKNPGDPVEMYFDTSPGTPEIYRRDAITKVYTIGYDLRRHVMWGADSNVNDYNSQWARDWIDRDRGVMQELGLPQQAIDDYFWTNARRYLGLAEQPTERAYPKPAQ